MKEKRQKPRHNDPHDVHWTMHFARTHDARAARPPLLELRGEGTARLQRPHAHQPTKFRYPPSPHFILHFVDPNLSSSCVQTL